MPSAKQSLEQLLQIGHRFLSLASISVRYTLHEPYKSLKPPIIRLPHCSRRISVEAYVTSGATRDPVAEDDLHALDGMLHLETQWWHARLLAHKRQAPSDQTCPLRK